MPRYFFEFYNDRAVEWDETGSECADRSEIEGIARQRLAAFLTQHPGAPIPFCMSVIAAGGDVVMTGTGVSETETSLFWR